MRLFTKLKTNFAAIVITIAFAILGVDLASHAYLSYYGDHKATMIAMNHPAEIYDRNLVPATTFHPGDGIVIRFQSHVDAVNCYAIYNEWLNGPVKYQFPATRTAKVFTKAEDRDMKIFFQLPNELPAGKYEWMLTTFPTCHNYEVPPAELDTGASFTVVDK